MRCTRLSRYSGVISPVDSRRTPRSILAIIACLSSTIAGSSLPLSWRAPRLGACRSIEGCHGFAGAPRALGGSGGHIGAPMSLGYRDPSRRLDDPDRLALRARERVRGDGRELDAESGDLAQPVGHPAAYRGQQRMVRL